MEEQGTRRPFPGFGQGFLLVLLVLVLQLAAGFACGLVLAVVNVALHRDVTAGLQHPALLAAMNILAVTPVIVLGVWLSRAPVREALPFGRVAWRALPALVLVILGYSIVFSEIDNVVRMLLPAPRWFAAFLTDLAAGESSPWGSLLATVVVAPILEEALFRGVILRGFLLRYTPLRAVLLSALLFALLHANPWQLLGPFAIGVLLGWLVYRTRSLVTAMLAHALTNAVPLLATIGGVAIPGFSTGFDLPPVLQPLWLDVVGLALVGGGLAALASCLGRPGPPEERT